MAPYQVSVPDDGRWLIDGQLDWHEHGPAFADATSFAARGHAAMRAVHDSYGRLTRGLGVLAAENDAVPAFGYDHGGRLRRSLPVVLDIRVGGEARRPGTITPSGKAGGGRRRSGEGAALQMLRRLLYKALAIACGSLAVAVLVTARLAGGTPLV